MDQSSWTEDSTARALQVWAEYQAQHAIEPWIGQTVGIEPLEGRVWFGSNALDAARKRDAEGVDTPLYFLRVGQDYYLRKGRRR